MSRLSEDDLIATFFGPIAGPAGLGLRDDAAVLGLTPGQDMVLTKDALVAGVHFFAEDPPESIARKALRVNLSDLAAKGAKPLGFMLALGLPGDWTQDWMARFADGLRDDAVAFDCALLGGDTVSTPGPLWLSVTALGSVPNGTMLPRTGVKPGDRLYVSGTIGDGALGLRLRLNEKQGPETAEPWMHALSPDERHHLLDRYLHPQPRLGLRAALGHANGGMDVSDGLVGDLAKMLRVSGVTATVQLPWIPLSDAGLAAMRADPAVRQHIATGGDDYEVIASVSPDKAAAFERATWDAGIRVTLIGVAETGTTLPRFLDRDDREVQFERGSYQHS